MRGSDPLSCDTVRCWWQATRYRVCAWASFACPNEQAVQVTPLHTVARTYYPSDD